MRPSTIEPACTLPTWDNLLSVAPELRRFETEAAEAGERSFGFWLTWVPHYGDFRRAIYTAAQATGADFGTIMRVVTARLESAYDAAYRQLHRGRNAQDAILAPECSKVSRYHLARLRASWGTWRNGFRGQRAELTLTTSNVTLSEATR